MSRLEINYEVELLPPQEEYFYSQSDTAVFCGGVGAGKSLANVCLAIEYALKYPGIEILMCAPTYGMLRDTLIRDFKAMCPREIIAKQVWGAYPEVIFIKNHGRQSTIRFRAFDDALKPRGLTIGLLIIDEITGMRMEVLEELLRRCRQFGMPNHKRFSTNPDSKMHWFYQRYMEPFLQGKFPDGYFHYIHTTTFDNYLLPKNYVDNMKMLETIRPGQYRRAVLGEWGDFDDDSIGAFQTVPKFTAPYLVAWIDTSYSDRSKTDRTSVTVDGFVPNQTLSKVFWPIEFTGKSWQKSITNDQVARELVIFLHQYNPIEACLESQLGDSTRLFIAQLKNIEKELGLPHLNWTWRHQSKNKHERIMMHVAGNKNRLYALEGTEASYLTPIVSYTKKAEHDDEIDSLAGGIDLWQTSTLLRNYIYAANVAQRMR